MPQLGLQRGPPGAMEVAALWDEMRKEKVPAPESTLAVKTRTEMEKGTLSETRKINEHKQPPATYNEQSFVLKSMIKAGKRRAKTIRRKYINRNGNINIIVTHLNIHGRYRSTT